MPELPEVEASRRLAERHCEGKEIIRATIADDEKVIEDIEPGELEKQLVGRTLHSTHRRGKHLWFELSGDGPALMFHFGMTGSLRVRGVDSAQYRTLAVPDDSWPPKYCKVELEFEGGIQIAFCDPRRFARVRFIQDPLSQEPIASLGFDLLLDLPTPEELHAMLLKERRAIKVLLLDQSFLAGVGNWVADEVLYQARIHPEQPANSLPEAAAAALRAALQNVAEAASDANADSERFPPGWLFHVRWDPKASPKIDGRRVEFSRVGGRATAIVPELQKLTRKAGAKAAVGQGKKADEDEEGEEGSPEEPAPKKAGKGKATSGRARKEESGAAAGGSATAARGRSASGRAKKEESGRAKKEEPEAPAGDSGEAAEGSVEASKNSVEASKKRGSKRGRGADGGGEVVEAAVGTVGRKRRAGKA